MPSIVQIRLMGLLYTLVLICDYSASLELRHNSQTIPNNSLLTLTEIGIQPDDILRCFTSRTNCCSSADTINGLGLGDWFLPSGMGLTEIQNTNVSVDFYLERRNGSVDFFRRNNVSSPEGLFYCKVPLTSGEEERAYVGLYLEGNGSIEIISLTANSSSLSILCTTSGGPVAQVIWEQNGSEINPNGLNYSFSQIVSNTRDAIYENTLVIRLPELFQGNISCLASNVRGNSTRYIQVSPPPTEDPTATNPTTMSPTSIPAGVYLSLRGTLLSNNSLITLSDARDPDSDGLLCITDLVQCCRKEYTTDGVAIGEWSYPDQSLVENMINSVTNNDAFYRNRGQSVVRLLGREGVAQIGGIFQCEVKDISGQDVFVYIGIYPNGTGSPTITSLSFDGVTLSLACISTGGPASDVTWIKDGVVIPENSTLYKESQRILDWSDSSYRNVLTGANSSDVLGTFECVVQNSGGEDRSSTTVAESDLPQISSITITSTMVASTSISLSWLGPTTQPIYHYQLNYTYLGICSAAKATEISVEVDGSTYTLAGLEENASYFVLLAAINYGGVVDSVSANISTLPTAPNGTVQNVQAVNIAMTTITLSWEPLECILQNSNITFYRFNVVSLYNNITTLLGSGTVNHTLENLIPGTKYEIFLSAINSEQLEGPALSFNITTPPVSEPLLLLKGQVIANNSVIDPNDIEEEGRALLCLTNLTDCCRRIDKSDQSSSFGNWQYANGVDIPIKANSRQGLFYDIRGMSAVRLNREGAGPRDLQVPGGMFRCEVPDAENVLREIFVGIYPPNDGRVGVELLTYDANTTSLICQSTGGPATSVRWIREAVELDTNGPEFEVVQIIVNTSLSLFHNILSLRHADERDNIGIYSCVVENSRGSATASVQVVEPSITSSIGAKIGSRTDFTCSSPNGQPREEIKWQDSTGVSVTTAANTNSLMLQFNPISPSDNNTEYRCLMTNGIAKILMIQTQPSGPPMNLQSSLLSSTSYFFSWEEPEDSIPSFFTYSLTCSPSLEGIPAIEVATPIGVTMSEVEGLEEGVTYVCLVAARAEGYSSKVADISITINETVPSAIPDSFTISQIKARNGTFSWEPLPILDRNGIIISYSLICNSTQGLVSRVFSTSGSFTVAGFWPDTMYRCHLWAANSAGRGPEVEMSIETIDDYSIFQLKFTVADCSTWVTSGNMAKRADIEAALVSELSTTCPSCRLDITFIREGRFTRCFELSSVIYRAQIHGNAQQTSSELVSLIQQWVSEQQTIQILGVEMAIDNQCDTSIISFDTEVCISPSRGVSLPVIVGAALGSVILLMVLFIVVLLVVFIRRHHIRQRKSAAQESTGKHNVVVPNEVSHHHTFDDISSDEENDDYAHIGPHLPPRHTFSGKNELSITTIPNRRALSGSQPSLRYKPSPLGDTYSEIDGLGKERRPSDYEPILVRNIGLMSTEALDTLNPAQFFPGNDRKNNQQETTRNIINDYEFPALHPVLGNQYETIGNPGFQNGSEISSAQNVDEGTKSSEEGEMIINQGYADLPMTRAASISLSNNPMYSTFTSTLKDKRLKEDASVCQSKNGVRPNHTEDGYCIPKLSSKLPQVDITTNNLSSVGNRDSNHGDADQSIYVNSGYKYAAKVMYTIPTSPKSSTNRVNRTSPSAYATIPDTPKVANADPNYHGYSVPHRINNIPQTDQIGTKIASHVIPKCDSESNDMRTSLDKVTNLSEQN